MARSAGVLLSITSLPSPYGIGTIGKEARKFADFLKKSGQTIWQILPVGPTSYGDSPYQSFSTYAGNPYLIDLDTLCEEGLLTKEEVMSRDWGSNDAEVDYEKIYNNRFEVLKIAYDNFKKGDQKAFTSFKRKNSSWLKNYALYMAVKKSFDMVSWTEWPDEEIKMRDEAAVKRYERKLKDDVDFWKFVQFKFYEQWESFRAYVNGLGIKILGDMPIYVAMDSADTWANPELFQLYDDGDPIAVAGCPPDYFSAEGQLWGNPLYNWEIHASENYAWWAERLQCAQKLYDVVRIDHFRGFESFWAVPFGETTAENGRWLPAPGMDFVNAVKRRLPGLSFIAEDLGFLTPEVHELVKNSGFPGMSILQFGFNPDANSDYLPHRVAENRVYYTGTHDNAPIMQWFAEASESERRFAEQYLALNAAEGINWGMIRGGMCSPAGIFIAQMQDVLGLSAEGRINTPGVASGNWQWRMLPHECSAALAEKLREYTRMYGRLHDCGEINYGHNTVVPREYCEKMPAHKNGTNCLFGCCGISRFSR